MYTSLSTHTHTLTLTHTEDHDELQCRVSSAGLIAFVCGLCVFVGGCIYQEPKLHVMSIHQSRDDLEWSRGSKKKEQVYPYICTHIHI